ncbi:MAG: hypothetical protein AAGJ96_08910 [Pseudomonadota bacterium]
MKVMPMNVLAIGSETVPLEAWAEALAREGVELQFRRNVFDTRRDLLTHSVKVLLLDLEMPEIAPLALADLAAFRHPDVHILPITTGTRFTDGSLYRVVPNMHFTLTPRMNVSDVVQSVLYCLRGRTTPLGDAPVHAHG